MGIISEFISRNVSDCGLVIIAFAVILLFGMIQFLTMRLRNDDRSDSNSSQQEDHQQRQSQDLEDDNNIDLDQLYPRIPYQPVLSALSDRERLKNVDEFYDFVSKRRSVRDFSRKSVSFDIIRRIIQVAGTAPSGANLQPWTFAVIEDRTIKAQIRLAVEAEEEVNYARRMGDKWVKDVSRLNVSWSKPYLELAPYLIIVFKQTYQMKEDGSRQETYYNEISTSIAVGLLLSAIQHAGLVTVTTTPLNAGPAIRNILQRPNNEKVLLLLPVGYPAQQATVPDLKRKSVEEIMKVF